MSQHDLIEVEELGPARLGPIVERMLVPGPAFAETVPAVEEEERSVFEGFAGKYVNTGALKSSLTSSAASGAIRQLTAFGFTFGSSIFYAVFQGTQGPGNHKAPSAILRATEGEAALAARTVMEYVLHGGERA